MNRVSTAGNYAITLANLAVTQQRQLEAGMQVSSQKIAQDLKGYAHKAETLTSMRTVQARVNALLDQNVLLADRFQTQDIALNQMADAVDGARQAITDALAGSRVDTLMQEMRGFFSDIITALNTKSQGRYLFAGGQIDTPPTSATAMSDLTNPVPVASFFHNDTFRATNQIDENSTIQGGMLADELASGVFEAFKTIQAFEETLGSGPFMGEMTPAQRTFLENQLAGFASLHKDVVNQAARNGAVQKRLENVARDLGNRADTLEGMIGNITNVDMAEAISRLELAQFAVQASAQVFVTLRNSSLLNYL